MKLPPSAPLLVTGASGFVGEHLTRRLVAARESVVGTYHTRPVEIQGAQFRQIDLADPQATDQLLAEIRPRAVIHTAAITSVDECRKQPQQAQAAILTATENLVQATAKHAPDAVLLALSTDIVFDGEAAPYQVGDEPKPISVYGRLKFAAEAPVRSYPRGLVVRTAPVYGAPTTHKGSFLGWMVTAMRKAQPLDLYIDEVRSPVWVADLTAALAALCDGRATGLLHAAGPEHLNRHEMGQIVAAALSADAALLNATHVADAPFLEPRARDVSLLTGDFWSIVGRQPKTMAEAMQHITPHLPRAQ